MENMNDFMNNHDFYKIKEISGDKIYPFKKGITKKEINSIVFSKAFNFKIDNNDLSFYTAVGKYTLFKNKDRYYKIVIAYFDMTRVNVENNVFELKIVLSNKKLFKQVNDFEFFKPFKLNKRDSILTRSILFKVNDSNNLQYELTEAIVNSLDGTDQGFYLYKGLKNRNKLSFKKDEIKNPININKLYTLASRVHNKKEIKNYFINKFFK